MCLCSRGISDSVEVREKDLTLSAGVADIPIPEVIIIHSQSQYCCVCQNKNNLD